MAGPVSLEDVIAASLQGVVNAQRDYEAWSEEWLWNAPEYLSTVYVAKAIGALSGAKYLTLENGAANAIEEAGARGRGRLHNAIRANGRFDILLWWANGTPRAPIEVKCQVMKLEKIRADIERIAKVLQRNKDDSSISFGAVVFYSSWRDEARFTAKEILDRSLDKILGGAKELVGDVCHVAMERTKVYVRDDGSWVGAALVLKPKNV